MRVTISADDKQVYVGGEPHIVNVSDLDPAIHAVQWYDTAGEVEYKTSTTTKITDFSPYQTYVDRWCTAKAAALFRQKLVTGKTPLQIAADVAADLKATEAARAQRYKAAAAAQAAQQKATQSSKGPMNVIAD
jgi:hypothetical protein